MKPTNLNLSQLGLKGQDPYLPGYSQAPLPTKPTFRKEPMITFHKVPPLARTQDNGHILRAGSVIGGLVAALGQLDHFARQADALNFLKHKAKLLLGRLVTLSDDMVAEYAKEYTNNIVDTANQQGLLLGQSAELFMQLSPRQKLSCMNHMRNMIDTTLTYEPAPVAPVGPLPNPNGWRRVVVETPYAGDVEENLRYLRVCLRDCIYQQEAPFASHGLYTQPGVLDDNDTVEREWGMDAGLVWAELADATVVYTDRGISPGMAAAIRRAENEGRPVEYRSLPHWEFLASLQVEGAQPENTQLSLPAQGESGALPEAPATS